MSEKETAITRLSGADWLVSTSDDHIRKRLEKWGWSALEPGDPMHDPTELYSNFHLPAKAVRFVKRSTMEQNAVRGAARKGQRPRGSPGLVGQGDANDE